MGYNTQVLILNDALDVIRKNPEGFVEGLYQAILVGSREGRDHIDIGVSGYANAASVIPTAHADTTRVLVSHGNWLWEIPGRYGLQQDVMKRAENEKFIRDELIGRCQQAIDAAKWTKNQLRAMGEK